MQTAKLVVQGLTHISSLSKLVATAYRISPATVWIKAADTLIDATLPVAIAYLAGLTTTALADAFYGVTGAREEVLLLVFLTTLAALIQEGWGRASGYMQFLTEEKIRNVITEEIYAKYLSLDFWRYEDKATTDLKNRAELFQYRFARGVDLVAGMFGSVLTFAVALIAVSYSAPIISAVVLAALIPTALVQYRTSMLDIAWLNAHQERNRMKYAYEGKLRDEESIIDTRLLGLGSHFLKSMRAIMDEKTRAEQGFRIALIKWGVLSYLAENGALLFSLIYTVFQIASKLQPVGYFVFVQSMVLRATGAMTSMLGRIGDLSETLAQFKDYDDFIQLPSQHDGTVPLHEPVEHLALRAVSFRYTPTAPEVLSDVSLEIKRGDHVAIVGENGAGKTTLVRLIMGMHAPTTGAVVLNGVNLSEYVLHTWHERLGILLQNFDYYNFTTVWNNVRFGNIEKKATAEAINTALKRAQAYTFVQSLPRKEQTVTSTFYGESDDSTRLSGGQWQRLAIARVFYRNPEVLILDEPTSALDARAEAEIFEEIHKEMQGKTVIIISHRFSTVRKAHKIVVLEGGKVKEMGTHEELMKLKGTYHTMFELQAKEYR